MDNETTRRDRVRARAAQAVIRIAPAVVAVAAGPLLEVPRGHGGRA